MTSCRFSSHVSALLLLAAAMSAQGQSAAISTDPAPDKAAPAAIQSFQLPSHGALLNALAYMAAGAGPHPIVILLHGFPGNERNLDLAQALRRAGDDVLFFDYRGSWGSPGNFSFTHSMEDTQAAIAYVRDPVNAAKLRADPSRVILIGHSMGGFMTEYAAAHDPEIFATVLISASSMGVNLVGPLQPEQRKAAIVPLARSLAKEGMAPLAGCTPASLAAEIVANADAWNISSLTRNLPARPLLVIHSDDGNMPENKAFIAALPAAAAARVTQMHFATDHSYSDHRIALQQAVLDFLAKALGTH